MNKKRKRLLLIFTGVLIFFALLAAGVVIYIAAFSRNNVNVQQDEKLFSLAKGGTVTEYYCDENYDAYDLTSYEPVLYKSVVLSQNRKMWVPIDEIDANLINAFISMEDRKFYSHSGFDLKRTLYAVANSLFHFRDTFGASTITQQVIKNISGDNELTVKRKLSEIIRAYNIERSHSKDEIMELYLNIIPMGENLFGVGAAANAYFGKNPDSLTLAEAATLVGITNAPTKYNPHTNPENCTRKRNDVLFAMYDFGVISEEEYKNATNQPLQVLEISVSEKTINSWFTETVNKDVADAMIDKLGISESAAQTLLQKGGLKIYTTENPEIQGTLEEYFYNSSNFPSALSRGLDYSMVISDSLTGNLLGIVGAVGKKQGDRLLNLALTPITPGSSLKPIALYAPLINEGRINWASVFDDVPVEFRKSGSTYIEYPKNYPEFYAGLTTVKDALRLSKNTVAVRLYNMLGAERIYSILKNDYGFNSLVRRAYDRNGNTLTDLASSPLALGQLTYGVSLRKLTEAYTVFPSEGVAHKGRSFIAVYDADGELLIDNSPDEHEVISPEAARIMNKLLMNVTESGTASAITLKNTIDTAGKTGTSGDDKDRLFIGYTPYLTAGIWCGYRDSSTSIGYVAPSHIKIWDEVMTKIHRDLLRGKSDDEIKSFSIKGLKRVEYCKDSGTLYGTSCLKDPRGSRLEVGYFLPSCVPKELCRTHVLCKYDYLTEGVSNGACPEEYLTEISLIRVPERHFPKEIAVGDAEYSYMELQDDIPFAGDYTVPYFYNMIPEGEYIGTGRKRKQFNSGCYLH